MSSWNFDCNYEVGFIYMLDRLHQHLACFFSCLCHCLMCGKVSMLDLYTSTWMISLDYQVLCLQNWVFSNFVLLIFTNWWHPHGHWGFFMLFFIINLTENWPMWNRRCCWGLWICRIQEWLSIPWEILVLIDLQGHSVSL